MILLPQIDPAEACREIGDFVVDNVIRHNYTGCVIGLSGGIDSSTTAALIKKAFDNTKHDLELIGYMLPTSINNPKDTEDAVRVADLLGIRYEVINLEQAVAGFRSTNPEVFESKYDRGNMISRIRANVLSTKAATGKKILAGTGNKDEDFGIGYYTLFGDGAVHISPIGNLSKRHVREVGAYLGLPYDVVHRDPSAGLEPGQSDFGDLGYKYDLVEMVIAGHEQGYSLRDLCRYHPIEKLAASQFRLYNERFGKNKFEATPDAVQDILRRHEIALEKMKIVHPPAAHVTYRWS